MHRLCSVMMAVLLTASMTLSVGCKTGGDMTGDGGATTAPTQPVDDGMVRSSVAFPTGDPATSAVLIERVAPAEVNLGQTFTYDIRVTNLSKLGLSNVVVTETPAESFQLGQSTPEVTRVSEETGDIAWSLGSMAPGQTRNIRVEGQAAEIGQLVNCVTVDYDLAACLTLNVVQPELALDIEAPLTVLKCEPIIMRYTVTNNGTGVAQNVRVNHDLPEGLLTDTGQTKVTTPAVQLQPGESRAFEIQLAASQSGEYENMARATGAGNLSAEDTAPTTVVAPELEITKTGPSEVYLGRNVTYEIVVTNVGDGEARDAVLTDAIPTGVDVVSSTPAATMVEGQATWNLGTLAPEESRTVSITLDPNVRPTLDNEATVTAYCAAAASATASTEVERIAAVLLEVIDEDDPVEVGATTTYVITVTNQGSATGENIKIACELEEQMRFVAEGSGGATEVASSEDGIVEFRPLAELGAGERATWRVVIEAASAGDVRFKVAMTEDRLERPVFETEATNFYE